MTTLHDDLDDVHPRRAKVSIAIAVLLGVPAIVLRAANPELSHPLEALLYGMAIVGAAFLLSWAAEVAQLDISAGLAIAILALIAVLPEYAVDFVFARKGGESFAETGAACLPLDGGTESPCSLALAEHDRGEPAVDRHRLDDGGVRRVLATALQGQRSPRASTGAA